MIVEVAEGRAPVIRGAEDFDSLHVTIVSSSLGHGDLAVNLEAVARRIDADHVWLSLDWLRDAGGRGQTSIWFARFDAMVAYARAKGWLGDGGESVRAHLDWAGR